MVTRILSVLAFSAPLLLSVPAFAEEVTIKASKHEKHGTHLTDGDGRAVYLFTTDTQAKGKQEAKISCTSNSCLKAWPPVYTDGKPKAGEGADVTKLGTTKFKGKEVATYDGWPLYYFVKDKGAGQATGQDIKSFGGEWYLVTPKGTKVGH